MGNIIKFRRKDMSNEAKRLKALAEGRVRYFNCNNCGGEIEIINEEYPDECPCCGLIIIGWDKEEERHK